MSGSTYEVNKPGLPSPLRTDGQADNLFVDIEFAPLAPPPLKRRANKDRRLLSHLQQVSEGQAQ